MSEFAMHGDSLQPLAPSQEWMLKLDRDWDSHRSAIVMARAFRLTGTVSPEALSDAFRDCVDRHAALRLVFPGTSAQGLTPDPPTLSIAELESGFDPAAFISDWMTTPIDVARDVSCRALFARVSQSEAILLFAVHHAVFDGRSWSILLSDWAYHYARRVGTGPGAEGAAGLTALDYAREACSEPAIIKRTANAEYWRNKFALDIDQRLDSESGPRPRLESRSFVLGDEKMAADIRTSARRARVTPFMVLLAAEAVFGAAWDGASGVVIHTPHDDRLGSRFERTVGCLIGLVLLSVEVRRTQTIGLLLAAVRSELILAMQHKDNDPFELSTVTPRAFEFYAREESRPRETFADVAIREDRIKRVKVGSPAMRLVEYKPVVSVLLASNRVDVTIELDTIRHPEPVFATVAGMFRTALRAVIDGQNHRVDDAIRSVLSGPTV